MLTLASLGCHLTAVSQGPFPPNHIANIVGDGLRTEIAGRVIEEPDIRLDKTYLAMEIDSLKVEQAWFPTLGRIRVRVISTGFDICHNDYVIISCYLYRPSGATNPIGFDYATYLQTKEIFAEAYLPSPQNITGLKRDGSLLKAIIAPLRQRLIAISKQYLAQEKSSLLTGFILGERREMTKEHQSLFRDTGTMHLMAVSGSNVGMVLLIFGCLLAPFHLPRSAKAIVLLLITAAFALLTRLEPSVVRASIMAAVGIIAYGWMRKPDLINLLAFAALLMLLWRPMQLYDVGFQLSFAAAFGIIYALPRLSGITSKLDRPKLKWLRWITIALLSTLAAQIAVLPLVAHYFHSIPLFGAIANLPVILLASIAIVLGTALFALSIFGGWLPLLAAVPLDFVLETIITVLKFFASLPQARMASAMPGWTVIILFWLVAYIIFETSTSRRFSRLALVSALVLINILIWSKVFERHQDWRIEFLDLRRNHAWVFEASERPTIACYDCYEPQDDAEGIIIPHILTRYGGRLDYILTTTPDSPEIGRIAAEFGSRIISFGDNSRGLGDFSEYLNTTNNVSLAGIKVLWGRSDNTNAGMNAYPAIEINVDSGALILAGWAGMTIRDDKFDSNIRLIELPWSHYARSECLNIIEACDPQFAVFSPDRYSFKAPESREKLTHTRERTVSTSLCGAFAIGDRGGAFEIETMKPRK